MFYTISYLYHTHIFNLEKKYKQAQMNAKYSKFVLYFKKY